MGMSSYVMDEQEKRLLARITIAETASRCAPGRYQAYFTDSVDGATDSPAPIIGFGDTHQDAISDLLANSDLEE